MDEIKSKKIEILRGIVEKEYKEIYNHEPFFKFVNEISKNLEKECGFLELTKEKVRKEIKKEAKQILDNWIKEDIYIKFAENIFPPNKKLIKELSDRVAKKSELPYYDMITISRVIGKWLEEMGVDREKYYEGENDYLNQCSSCNKYVFSKNDKWAKHVDKNHSHNKFDKFNKKENLCGECLAIERQEKQELESKSLTEQIAELKKENKKLLQENNELRLELLNEKNSKKNLK